MISKNIKSTTLRKHLPNKLFILKIIIILFFITISQNTTIQVLENTKQKKSPNIPLITHYSHCQLGMKVP